MFVPEEVSSLIDEVLLDEDGVGTICGLAAGDARALIDVIDEACYMFTGRRKSVDRGLFAD